MDDPSLQGAGKSATAGSQPGVIGIALAAVLTAALAQGSWQWFATYVGVTLLALIFTFYRLPTWMPGALSAYMRNLTAYSLVVGLCVAITLAPALQRWAWLFPMPGTRSACPELGKYEGIHAEAALANLAGRDGVAMTHAQETQSKAAVSDCLSATTTQWLPVYAAGAAVLVGLSAWALDRARVRKEAAAAGRPRQD
ncbi:hypothetical protein J7E87_10850 [Streptomyces sp. ISL-1]|uniref:hypothetical protein n=1 Tax=Streptomyces sp. ISL-1 TaxID=2817657 RepID=UPI001BE538D5|nr:hypothetical protein [Streptomyces sp. ISL-1]MBT2389909.1 hypothetical protein [Streptomyces sp. ISL-1]